MITANLISLMIGLALPGADCRVFQRDEASTSTSTSSCLSPTATCGTEISWGGGFFGKKKGLAEVYDCYEFCNEPRRWGECKSFLWDDGSCWIFEVPANEAGDAVAGTGDEIWDKECGDCGAVPSPTVPISTSTPTCLPSSAVCEVEGKLKEGAGSHLRASGSSSSDNPYSCWETCSDGRRPAGWCVAFSWEPSTGQCLVYDASVSETHDEDSGSGVWVWDKECWSCGVSGYT